MKPTLRVRPGESTKSLVRRAKNRIVDPEDRTTFEIMIDRIDDNDDAQILDVILGFFELKES